MQKLLRSTAPLNQTARESTPVLAKVLIIAKRKPCIASFTTGSVQHEVEKDLSNL